MGLLQTMHELSGIEAASRVTGFVDTTVYTSTGESVFLPIIISQQSSPIEFEESQLSNEGISDQLRREIFERLPGTVHYTVDKTVRNGREFRKRIGIYQKGIFARNIGRAAFAIYNLETSRSGA